jgi:hypothetical protein
MSTPSDRAKNVQDSVSGLSVIPASRKRKASDVFASMVEEDTNSVKNKMSKSVKNLKDPKTVAPKKKKKARKINDVSIHTPLVFVTNYSLILQCRR